MLSGLGSGSPFTRSADRHSTLPTALGPPPALRGQLDSGALEPSEIVEPDRCTTIEPPGELYGVSLLSGVVAWSGTASGLVLPVGVPVADGSGWVPPVGTRPLCSESSDPSGVDTVGVP
jgi:hypothetical protein